MGLSHPHTDGFNGHSWRLADINLKILPPICLYLFKRFRQLSLALIDSQGRLEERKLRDWQSYRKAGRQWRNAKRVRRSLREREVLRDPEDQISDGFSCNEEWFCGAG